MSTERLKENDPYIQFCLDNSPWKNGKGVGFESITDICNEWGGNRKSIYSLADRGVYRLDTMIELCVQFRIPKRKFLRWLIRYVAEIFEQYLIGSKAS